MRKLLVFNHVSLDGYFVDQKGDMSWAHNQDPEWNEFVNQNASGDGQLLFGRKTYDMMAGFWPTPMAHKTLPTVAERMNSAAKVVFSRTMDKADWNNTRLLKGDLAEEVRKLKSEPGAGMVLMGSGTIVSQLAQAGLIDEYQLVVNPIILGSGRTLFESVKDRLRLKLTKSRAFGNGSVVLSYAPTGA